MDLSNGGYNNVIDSTSITFKDSRTQPVKTSSITYNHDSEVLELGKNINVSEHVLNNRTHTITAYDGKYKVNNVFQENVSISLVVGEKVSFNQNDGTNNNFPIFISKSNSNDIVNDVTTDGHTVAYTIDSNSSITSFTDFSNSFNAANSIRTVSLTPVKAGTLYAKTPTDPNRSVIICVNDRDNVNQLHENDLSLNKNVDIAGDLSVYGITLFKNLETDNILTKGKHDILQDVSMATTLTVAGATSLKHNVDISENLDVSGNIDLKENLVVHGNTTLTGNLDVASQVSVEQQVVTNQTFNIKVSGDTFLVNDVSGHNTDIVMNVGEKITFKQHDATNDDPDKHSIFISTHVSNDIVYEASMNSNVINYYIKNGSGIYEQKQNIVEYDAALNNLLEPYVEFIPAKTGNYYFQSKHSANLGGTITVHNNNLNNVDNNKTTRINNKAMVFDFSTNWQTGDMPRLQFIFHEDY
jgi:hypothetical protein